jgi:hypothetical protein
MFISHVAEENTMTKHDLIGKYKIWKMLHPEAKDGGCWWCKRFHHDLCGKWPDANNFCYIFLLKENYIPTHESKERKYSGTRGVVGR